MNDLIISKEAARIMWAFVLGFLACELCLLIFLWWNDDDRGRGKIREDVPGPQPSPATAPLPRRHVTLLS